MESEIDAAERQLGLAFRDRNLLWQALIHPSFANENPGCAHNERLEFLGDAILGFIVSHYLYQALPDSSEGVLTSLRSQLVRKEALAEIARSLHLGDFIMLGRGKISEEGRSNPSVLADSLESLVGAIFLDQGLEVAKNFLVSVMEPLLQRYRKIGLVKDPKSSLQELAQRRWRKTPWYRVVAEAGPDHSKEFTVEVLVGENPLGLGTGTSKREAEMAAALMALSREVEGQEESCECD